MTEISPFQQHTPATQQHVVPPTEITVSLAEWSQELDAAGRIANVLCATEFVPKGLRGSVEATAAAILTGREIGLTPMNALANIFVVQGRPAMYARTMVALVLSRGHEIERTVATEQTVTVRARRRGAQSWQEFTWTIARAQKAGYTSNALYAKDPQAMLTAKAQTEACRTVFPDVLAGMASTSVEEIDLDGVIEVTETPAPAPKRTVQRKPRPAAPAPEPPPVVEDAPAVAVDQDDEPAAQQDDATAPAPSTRSQWSRLGNALDAVGIVDKADKTEAMRSWAKDQDIDAEIGSAKDLTAEQIEQLIAELADDPDARGDTPAGDWPTQDVAS